MNSHRLQAALQRIEERKRLQQQQKGIISHVPNIHGTEVSPINGTIIERTDSLGESGSIGEIRRDIIEYTEERRTDGEFISASEWKLNDLQEEASTRINNGESICLIGKAGTGKTTAIRETVSRLIQTSRIPLVRNTDGHKYLKAGYSGVVCCAFTNRATNNIAKGFDLAKTPIHFITIHKLLEYKKEEFVVEDKETGLPKRTFRFVPSRDRYNPIPQDIKLIILEESSQINESDLHNKLLEATTRAGHNVQFVYLGDLQQLPPIGGNGILGYKINQLPSIELTQIYRQSAENPIIQLAWDVSNGRKFSKDELIRDYSSRKDLTAPIQINFWQSTVDWEQANVILGNMFCTQIDKGIFNWDRGDIILMPYNKKFGTIELNKRIAQHLSIQRGSPTYEIISGFQKHYYSVGDKVLFAKKEGIIERIIRNGKYAGKTPLPPSVDLTRDGTYVAKDSESKIDTVDDHMSEEELDRYLANLTQQSMDEETQNQASHICHIRLLSEQMPDGSTEITASTRGDYGEMEFGYAISIHKSQGSEWRKVFLILHNSHHQLNREMLYTAITRASQQLFIICEPDSFIKAVGRQRIPGDTLEEKKLWFREKMNKQQQLNIENGEDDE